MSNSRQRAIRYKPRCTQMEAYDLLPLKGQEALREGPQEWDTVNLLNTYRKLLKGNAPSAAARRVADSVWIHQVECDRGYPWRTRKVGQSWSDTEQSPHNLANATMAISGERYA
mgnify:FL=1